MCSWNSAKQIMLEMLWYLEIAHYAICEVIILKVAILAEKYAVDYSWYVDTILNLIRIAGDYVSEEVWYRVLQIVTNRDDVQGYAAKTVFEVSTPSPPPSGGLRAEKGQLGLWSQPALATILLPPWPPCFSQRTGRSLHRPV